MKNKKVLIVGLGLQGGGVALAKFFNQQGWRVTITDLKKASFLQESLNQLKNFSINYTLGKHDLNDFLMADLIVKGPSVPWHLKEIQISLRRGKRVVTEPTLFFKYSPTKNIIGVTGTRGKTTTAMMIYKVLKNQLEDKKRKVYLAGNIPHRPMIALIGKIRKEDFVVLELSSWSLSGLRQEKLSPHYAVFTSFYPDHLNYYADISAYWRDKEVIFSFQKPTDYLIINQRLAVRVKGKTQARTIFFQKKDFPGRLKFLSGDHNQENAAAAYQLAKVFSLNLEKALKTLQNFRQVPFREETIFSKGNLTIINDTTSTTPIATIKAIDTFENKGKIILILGGKTKNLPTDRLVRELAKTERIILLAGSFTDHILYELKKKFADKLDGPYSNFSQAVKKAYFWAKKISIHESVYLIFSPAATSFSMFKNEFDRGDKFNQLVRKIINDQKN